MGKGRRGDRSTPELLPRLVEQIGVEPMTDNPTSSAHQKVRGQEAMVDVDCCSIQLSYSRRTRGRIRTANQQFR